MKKISSLSLLVIVASMIFNGIPISIEAQIDSSVLLKIALQAQREVKQQISSDSPEEIKRLFEEASRQVTLLERSLERDDPSANQHFLNAMNMFKRITLMLSDRSTAKLESEDVAASSAPQRDYNSNLERLKKFISTLKSIARSQSVNFDEADRLVAQAAKQIRENDDGGLKTTLEQLKIVLNDIKKELHKYASQTTSVKTIKFFSNILDRLEKKGADQELLNDARQILSNFEHLIADGNYDEAKHLKNELTQKIRQLYKSIP